MKKVIIFIIAILIAGGLGFYVGYYLENNKTEEKEDNGNEGKVKVQNIRKLPYSHRLDVNDDGYEILAIIDNKEDYEEFVGKYEVITNQEEDGFISYNPKYKYIMVGFEIDSCTETITPKKYKLKGDKLTLSVDVETSCGLCALEGYIYEITIDKDVEFKDVKIKYNYTNETDCPEDVAYKPVLYLYPEKEQEVTVKFAHPEYLTTTYPKYTNGWTVVAKPNGDLLANNKYYYALYWEELNQTHVDFSEGFYVTKDNAIEFLEEKLTTIGLNEKERNEFIMYWLPILEKNEQNLVYFELTDSLQAANALDISPALDSLLRVRIHVKKVDSKVDIKEQKLETFTRTGFTAIEWGGVTY